MFSKTWKPKKTRPIQGPVITRDGSFKKRGNHMEQREKLGIAPAPRGRSNTKQPPPEPSNALQKVEVEKTKQDDSLNDLSYILGDLKLMAVDRGSEIKRYEGKKVKEEITKSEAKILGNAIKNGDKKKPIEDEKVVRILSTRSKYWSLITIKRFMVKTSPSVYQDLGAYMRLTETVQCLYSPQIYFSKTLDMAMTSGADENTKEGLIRVIVTPADADMKAIKEEYNKQFGLTLAQKIEQTANWNFKDFLLTTTAQSD
ncbi:hypothetical protein GIB67_032592 [Kingdonia uniflora]|uniref:Uncharacterized protein n=1 Tax=Kingdonia uniflora TaxID=39325 RepID=A0A7J7LSA5_9MAGN|nr:hypothetical protein GIB67_032592 [Kingdonia uniflora]